MKKNLIIPYEVANMIYQYLITKPFQETEGLITLIRNLEELKENPVKETKPENE